MATVHRVDHHAVHHAAPERHAQTPASCPHLAHPGTPAAGRCHDIKLMSGNE